MNKKSTEDQIENVAKAILLLADAITQLAESLASVTNKSSASEQPKPEPDKITEPEPEDNDFDLDEPESEELTFDQVSSKFFDVLDFIAEKTDAAKSQSAAEKLLKKHTGGKPLSKKSLPEDKYEAFLVDVEKCKQIIEAKYGR